MASSSVRSGLRGAPGQPTAGSQQAQPSLVSGDCPAPHGDRAPPGLSRVFCPCGGTHRRCTLSAVGNGALMLRAPQRSALRLALQGVVFAFSHPQDQHLHLSSLSGNSACVRACVRAHTHAHRLRKCRAAQSAVAHLSRDALFESSTARTALLYGFVLRVPGPIYPCVGGRRKTGLALTAGAVSPAADCRRPEGRDGLPRLTGGPRKAKLHLVRPSGASAFDVGASLGPQRTALTRWS